MRAYRTEITENQATLQVRYLLMFITNKDAETDTFCYEQS